MSTEEKNTHKKRIDRFYNFFSGRGFVVIFILWVIFLSFATRSFATLDNIFIVLRQASIIGILAIAEHFIVLLGTMDISVASVLTVSGVATGGLLVNAGLSPFLSILLVILISAFIGFGNGTIVTRLKINPIIATLGMMSILEGAAFIYTKGKTIYGDPIAPIEILARGRVLGFPVPVLIMFILYIIAYLLLNYTKLGAYIFAVGNNEQATWLAGVKVDRIKRIAFLISGVLCGWGGIMQTARQGSASGGMGADFLFPVLTAVILGGASLSGGKGKVINTLIAAVFLTTISNGMVLLGVDIYIQKIIQGSILIIALSLDQLRIRKANV